MELPHVVDARPIRGGRGLVLLTCGLLTIGCPSRPSPPPPPSLPTASGVDLGPPRPVAPPRPSAQPFALVAVDEVSRLHKLVDGSVVANSGNRLYALDAQGGVHSLDSVSAALQPVRGDRGTVGGSWPGRLLVETFRLGGSDGFTTSLILRGDEKQAIIERRLRGGYFLPPSLWRGGALLTLQADGHSTLYGAPLDRSGRFELIGPTKEKPPQLPKEAILDDSFVAYPSGAVFALGGRRSRPLSDDDASEYEQEHHYMLDGALLWQSLGPESMLQPVQLPETSPRDRLRGGQLLRGVDEQHTLVFGMLEVWRQRQSSDQPYLARYTATGWRRIPIALPLRHVDTGRDGQSWAIAGSDGYGPSDDSFLVRVTLTADGGVTLEPQPLAPDPAWLSLGESAASGLRGCTKLRPRELAVVAAGDRWLTAQCLGGQDWAMTVLLHTQPQRPLVSLLPVDSDAKATP